MKKSNQMTVFSVYTNRFTIWLWLFLTGLILASCTNATPIAVSTPTLPTITTTLLPSSMLTPTPFLVRTKEPVKTTPPDWLKITPTITSLPTLHPLPTYAYPESVHKIWQLLITNGGCRLPCFWGITPGETTTAEFIQFTSQFPEVSDSMDKRNGIYTVYYVPPVNTDYSFVVEFFEQNSIIEAIGLASETADLSFPLPRLLKEYGEPDDVLIGPDRKQYGFQMFVLYEKLRIVVEYNVHLRYNNDYLCYDANGATGIVTWADGKDWTSFVNLLLPGDDIYVDLKPLNELTVYDTNSFYKQLSDKNRPVCMKTLTTKP